MNIRPIEHDEYGLLEEFLYLAVFVPPGSGLPSREVIREPAIYAYIDGFGRPDDVCLIAEEDETIFIGDWALLLCAKAARTMSWYWNLGRRLLMADSFSFGVKDLMESAVQRFPYGQTIGAQGVCMISFCGRLTRITYCQLI
jgi:hypothetical protein